MGSQACCQAEKILVEDVGAGGSAPAAPVHQPEADGGEEDEETNEEDQEAAAMSRRESRESRESQKSAMSVRRLRLQSKSQLFVDKEVLRGILLSKTLRRFGALWLTSPADLNESARGLLWNQSHPAVKLDRFLSHTWWTSGRLKLPALLLQSGWPFMMLCYMLGAAVAILLSVFEVLPLPFERSVVLKTMEIDVAWGPWVFLFTSAAVFLGFFISPYIPLPPDPQCFLDVVCIHQADLEIQKRGVYGLGGFLAASKEMHILWSPPYLTRLWCVFELAAFRIANPSGRIVVRPLFVELQTLWYILGGIFCGAITIGWLSTGLPYTAAYIVAYLLASSPFLFICHWNRRYMSEKYQLISSLEHFRLADVLCRLDKDKEFIYDSINDWYGSEEAFAEHVRGPLKEELLSSTTDIPLSYSLLMVTPFFSVSLDTMVACFKAKVPFAEILPRIIANDVGWAVLWFVLGVKLSWRLSECFASPRSNRALDYVTSVLIYLGFYVCFSFVGGEITVLVWSNLLSSVAWTACLAVLVGFLFRKRLC